MTTKRGVCDSNSAKGVSVLHINVQSLRNKFLESDIYFNEVSPDIIVVSEHWLIKTEVNMYIFNNYQLVNYFCREACKGGGVIMYAKKNVKLKPFEIKNCIAIEKHCEFICTDVYINNELCTLIGLYRSPSGDIKLFVNKLNDILDSVFNRSKFIIITGDFNIDFNKTDDKSRLVTDLLDSYGIIGLVTEPTRVTPTSSSRIDNIFSNLPSNAVECEIIKSCISDHYSQKLSIRNFSINNKKPLKVSKRLFNENNLNAFRFHLNKETWASIYTGTEVNRMSDDFLGIFQHYFDTSFPKLPTYKKHVRKKYFSPELKILSDSLRDLNLLYKSTGDPNILQLYKTKKRNYKKFVSNYTITENDNKIINSKNKSKAVWNVFNDVTNKISDVNDNISIIKNNIKIDNPKEVANLFIEEFSLPPSDIPVFHNINHCAHSMFLEPTNSQEICDIVAKLESKNSSGLDEIPISIIKKVISLIAEPLSFIINQCLLNGIFPDALKDAKVVPIFKKGSKTEILNYRPISILPAISKIFEKIIYKRLYSYLIKFNILTSTQYGFLPNLSTEHAIYNALSFISDCVDKKEKVAGIFFDFSRAFDTINHDLLLHKLENYGVRGISLSLFRSYLSNRNQQVCLRAIKDNTVTNFFSDRVLVSQGVPQGSILGPILFLIYVNDMPNFIELSSFYQFADDSTAIEHSDTINELSIKCTNIIEKMNEWSKNNTFNLNPGKTNLIVFNKCFNKTESVYVKLNGKSVPNLETTKFLGIVIENTLGWQSHICTLTAKLNSSIYVCRFIRQQVSLDSLKIYYFAYVQSLLNYGVIFWGGDPHFSRLFISQKRFIKSMMGVSNRTSCKPLFISLKIMSLPSLYIYRLVNFVRFNKHLFMHNSDVYNNMATRSANDLRIPPHNSTAFQKNVKYRAIKAYNNLPFNLKSISNMESFKKRTKAYFLENCYYSFAEYLLN